MSAAVESPGKAKLALRLRLASGPCSFPLERVHQLVGYAALRGEADEYFVGWLAFHGEQVPVFDLNRVVCDVATPEHFGSRILILHAPDHAGVKFLGLLAAEVTDTVRADDASVPPLDVNSYLPMLYTLIPERAA
jgi:chemotaxis signal transduction protein